jgi:chaperone modulatory protein CbpM
MNEPSTNWIEGYIVDDDSEFTLTGLCRATGASEEQVVLWVSEGALGPHEGAPSAWRFKGLSLCHTRIALRLVNEFEINAPGIALALDLLEEIDLLRARVGRL